MCVVALRGCYPRRHCIAQAFLSSHSVLGKEKDRILLLPARPPFIERNEGIAFDDLIRQISPLQQLGGRNDVKDGSKQSARAGMAACVSFFQAQIASDRPLF
jgi:hypothetical protein